MSKPERLGQTTKLEIAYNVVETDYEKISDIVEQLKGVDWVRVDTVEDVCNEKEFSIRHPLISFRTSEMSVRIQGHGYVTKSELINAVIERLEAIRDAPTYVPDKSKEPSQCRF